jgi:hypothetical protein
MKRASIVLIFVIAFSTTLRAQTSAGTLRTVPAAELASSYRELLQITDFLPMVESGGTLHLPDRTVTRDNLEQVKAELADRQAVLKTTITERGYATVSGTYVPKAASACKKIPSGWDQGIGAGTISQITISQEAFELQLVQEFTNEGESGTFEIRGVIVDSTLAFDDVMNSDFGFNGQVTAGTITVRPQVDQILAAWPSWIKAPNRKDLSACEVSLALRTK